MRARRAERLRKQGSRGETVTRGPGERETRRDGDGVKRIKTHRDLEVYRMAFEAAMRIFELTKRFPKEETYSLTDQIRRSSRSVCANLAEAWRRRRYEGSLMSMLRKPLPLLVFNLKS